jgi:hypothetical protein
MSSSSTPTVKGKVCSNAASHRATVSDGVAFQIGESSTATTVAADEWRCYTSFGCCSWMAIDPSRSGHP